MCLVVRLRHLHKLGSNLLNSTLGICTSMEGSTSADSVLLKVLLDCILSFSNSNNRSFSLSLSARCSSSFLSSMMRFRHSLANSASYVGLLTIASLISRTLKFSPIVTSKASANSNKSCYFPLAKKAILNNVTILLKL